MLITIQHARAELLKPQFADQCLTSNVAKQEIYSYLYVYELKMENSSLNRRLNLIYICTFSKIPYQRPGTPHGSPVIASTHMGSYM